MILPIIVVLTLLNVVDAAPEYIASHGSSTDGRIVWNFNREGRFGEVPEIQMRINQFDDQEPMNVRVDTKLNVAEFVHLHYFIENPKPFNVNLINFINRYRLDPKGLTLVCNLIVPTQCFDSPRSDDLYLCSCWKKPGARNVIEFRIDMQALGYEGKHLIDGNDINVTTSVESAVIITLPRHIAMPTLHECDCPCCWVDECIHWESCPCCLLGDCCVFEKSHNGQNQTKEFIKELLDKKLENADPNLNVEVRRDISNVISRAMAHRIHRSTRPRETHGATFKHHVHSIMSEPEHENHRLRRHTPMFNTIIDELAREIAHNHHENEYISEESHVLHDALDRLIIRLHYALEENEHLHVQEFLKKK